MSHLLWYFLVDLFLDHTNLSCMSVINNNLQLAPRQTGKSILRLQLEMVFSQHSQHEVFCGVAVDIFIILIPNFLLNQS
jgi:hypothetical protein